MSSQSSYPDAPASTRLLEPTFANNLTVMWRVVYGLMLRESRTRYGTSDIGYLWALIDPAIQMLLFWAIFGLLQRAVPVPATMPVFLVTGILPFLFWRNCATRGGTATAANLPLLTYPQVKVFDVVVARILLDAGTTIMVAAIFIVALRFVVGQTFVSWVRDPIILATGVLTLIYFSFCSAVFSSSLARIWRPWPQIFGYLSRPLYLTSGIFFTLQSLPTGIKAIAQLNPLAHMLEWIRTGAIPGFISTSYSPLFIYMFATIMLFIGMVIDWVLRMIGHSEEAH